MTPSRRALRPLALAVLAGLTLTGCGAGIDAQTNQRSSYTEGANVVLPNGQMLVRNFYLAPPDQDVALHERGDDARAYVVLVNQGDRPDRLVSASSPVASDITFWTGGDPEVGVAEHTEEFLEVFDADRAARPGGTDNRALPGDATDDVAGGASPSPSPGAGGAAADGQEVDGYDIAVGDKTEVLPGTGYLLFENLREDVFPGTSVEVTLEFEEAGSITFPAFVHLLSEPADRETPSSAEAGH